LIIFNFVVMISKSIYKTKYENHSYSDTLSNYDTIVAIKL